jgi:hypothetical protein
MASFGVATLSLPGLCSYDAALTGPGGWSVRPIGLFFSGRALILKPSKKAGHRSEPIGR